MNRNFALGVLFILIVMVVTFRREVLAWCCSLPPNSIMQTPQR
jgi:hypothetical protein